MTGSGSLASILMTARSVFGIVGDEAGDGGAAVGERHLDVADAFDDVVVGEDVAARVDDDAGAHAVDLPHRRRRSRARRFGPHGLAAVDVDDRGLGLLDGPDDRRVAQLAGGGRRKRRGHSAEEQSQPRQGADSARERAVLGHEWTRRAWVVERVWGRSIGSAGAAGGLRTLSLRPGGAVRRLDRSPFVSRYKGGRIVGRLRLSSRADSHSAVLAEARQLLGWRLRRACGMGLARMRFGRARLRGDGPSGMGLAVLPMVQQMRFVDEAAARLGAR